MPLDIDYCNCYLFCITNFMYLYPRIVRPLCECLNCREYQNPPDGGAAARAGRVNAIQSGGCYSQEPNATPYYLHTFYRVFLKFKGLVAEQHLTSKVLPILLSTCKILLIKDCGSAV